MAKLRGTQDLNLEGDGFQTTGKKGGSIGKRCAKARGEEGFAGEKRLLKFDVHAQGVHVRVQKERLRITCGRNERGKSLGGAPCGVKSEGSP